jgi:hypothetical protein
VKQKRPKMQALVLPGLAGGAFLLTLGLTMRHQNTWPPLLPPPPSDSRLASSSPATSSWNPAAREQRAIPVGPAPGNKTRLNGDRQDATAPAAADQPEDYPRSPNEDPGRVFWLSELRASPLVNGAQLEGYELRPPPAIAKRYGLQRGDVVISINGVALNNDTELNEQLQKLGDTVEITVLRNGEPQTVWLHPDATDSARPGLP